MNTFICENFNTLKTNEEFVNLLFKCYKNSFKQVPIQSHHKEGGKELYVHHYGKIILKEWLEKIYGNNFYIEIEYPITAESCKKNITKKLFGINPSRLEINVLLGSYMISRVDIGVFKKSDDSLVAVYEVAHTSKCNEKKINALKKLGIKTLYEIDAEYMIKYQVNHCPSLPQLEEVMDKLI